jgi:electron transfer flavoprotein alpha/beta subunit
VVEPRYPSFKGIMAAKSKPVDEVKVDFPDVTVEYADGSVVTHTGLVGGIWHSMAIRKLTALDNGAADAIVGF